MSGPAALCDNRVSDPCRQRCEETADLAIGSRRGWCDTWAALRLVGVEWCGMNISKGTGISSCRDFCVQECLDWVLQGYRLEAVDLNIVG